MEFAPDERLAKGDRWYQVDGVLHIAPDDSRNTHCGVPCNPDMVRPFGRTLPGPGKRHLGRPTCRDCVLHAHRIIEVRT